MLHHIIRILVWASGFQIATIGGPADKTTDGHFWKPLGMCAVTDTLYVIDHPDDQPPLGLRIQAFDLVTSGFLWKQQTPIAGDAWNWDNKQEYLRWYSCFNRNGANPLVTDGTSLYFISRVVLSTGEKQFVLRKFDLAGQQLATWEIVRGAVADQVGLAYHAANGFLYYEYTDDANAPGHHYIARLDTGLTQQTIIATPRESFAMTRPCGICSAGDHLLSTQLRPYRDGAWTCLRDRDTWTVRQSYPGRGFAPIAAGGGEWIAVMPQNGLVKDGTPTLERRSLTNGALLMPYGVTSGGNTPNRIGFALYASTGIDAGRIAVLDQTFLPVNFSSGSYVGDYYQAYEVGDVWSKHVVFVQKKLAVGTWLTPVRIGEDLSNPNLTIEADGTLSLTVTHGTREPLTYWYPYNHLRGTLELYRSIDGGTNWSKQ